MSIQDHDSHKVDSISGTTTTGHSWDGIEELNTPLPKWWLTILYASIIWAIGYVIVYPAIPLVSSFTQGAFGWSSRAAVEADLAELVQQRAPVVAALSKASITEIEKDPKLLAFARASGRVTFGDNCAPCHGAGGGGAKSYPNLNDDDWLWGGSAEQIYETIAYGIRSGHPKAHEGNMPAFGRDGLLKPAEISQVADYVRALSGLSTATGYDKAIGAKVFAENCAACHGDEGKGNQELGAPNLTDQIWLYGSDKATISESIINGRGNVMPAWVGRLDETTIKALTVYVHTLGGGR